MVLMMDGPLVSVVHGGPRRSTGTGPVLMSLKDGSGPRQKLKKQVMYGCKASFCHFGLGPAQDLYFPGKWNELFQMTAGFSADVAFYSQLLLSKNPHKQ